MEKKPVLVAVARAHREPELETMLAAWHEATCQLENTHEALREEIRRLTAELEARDRQLDSDRRLGDAGRMAAHVAGEVRNNLVPVSLNVSLLRRRLADDPIALNILGKIASGVTTIDAAVSDLADFVCRREPRWCTFSLAKLIEEVLAPLAPQFASQSVDVILDVPAAQRVRADRAMFRQVLRNLVLNAAEAMPDGGTLTITSTLTPRGIELEVADTGPGLPEETRRRLFEPFFTTRPQATGLGLAIVHQMVEAHGGYVTAMNCPEGGAAFTFCIPQHAMKAAA